MPRWTVDQQNAINARNSNILVSAAAGSGKTAVLVERVVRLITDEVNPVDIDKLLVVTFTNAAAAEMKNRISNSLSAMIREQPNNTNVLRQLSLLPNAKICTIDSFCMNLVRENFFKLDISQDFKVLENSQQLLIEQTAVEEIIEKLYEEDDKSFKSLVELLSAAKNDDDFIKAVKKIHHYLSAQPFPLDWLSEAAEYYQPNTTIDESVMKAYIVDEIKDLTDYAEELVNASKAALSYTDEMYDAYRSMLDKDFKQIKRLKTSLNDSWDTLIEVSQSISFSRAPSAPRGYTSNAKTIIFANRDSYKKIFSEDLPALLTASSEEFTADNAYLYPLFQTLIQLIQQYSERMMAIKKEMNAYSFSDIEHFAIELLFFKNESGKIVRSELASSLEDTFYEILVDEYQDTNAAQDLLFEMLSSGRNRFMVGDVKQSIYRFRLAMPQIFTDKKQFYRFYSKNSGEKNQKIILDKNFRSRKGICDFTNFLFSHLMSAKIGELDYTAEEYLNNGADYPETDIPCAQLNIVETPVEEDADEFEARQTAAMILAKIKNKEQIKDGEITRNIRFGDFAVLFRSSKNRMPVFSKVFAEFGIPTISNNRVNLFENNEVAILVSLLRVIDNPIQDVPLLATLMSVFYGYTADDIASARVNFKAQNLYSSICKDKTHFSAFLDDLEKYRKYAASMSVESFLRQLISDTSYLSLISAMGNHEQRKLNVMKLVELAKQFDKGENVGLTAFMRYIDAVIEAKLEVESADVSGADEDCVSLMSIHKSKGLEFPVVILAGAAHRYNNDDLKDAILLNHRLGVGLKVNNEELLYRYNSLQYACIKNQNSYAAMSENLRVMYVAVTRAKEQFIAFASFKDPATHIDNLSKKLVGGALRPMAVKKISNDADLLLLCALLHKDGGALRTLCSTPIDVQNDFNFELSVRLLDENHTAREPSLTAAEPNEELVKAIADKLRFQYNRRDLSAYSSKRTASSLDEKEQSFRFFAKTKPAFLSGNGMTGAEKGTAMHEFMQHCDYYAARADLEGEIRRMLESAFITERQAASLNREKLSSFFNSDLAKRMFESDKLYREIKVSSFVPLSELEDTEYTDSVLVQGIADCVFEENGELVLVDYKTDYVKSEEELLSLYQNQIAFYKKAVSKTLGKQVKEAMLYSFCLSKPCIYK